jgi:hypothetical protein
MNTCDNCNNDYDEEDEGATEHHCSMCYAMLKAEELYDERERNKWQG